MKRMKVFFAVLLAALAISSIAFASEGGGGHAVFTAANVKDYGLRILNFVIFAGLLYKFAGAKVKDFFVGRRDGIKNDLDDLQARQAEAEKKLKAVEASIANMATEKQQILDDAKAQGEAIKAAIIEKAKNDAAALTEQARRTASNEAQAAIESIRAELADMVIATAEKIVAEKLSAEDHDKLVDDYLTKVVLN
ncbi:F0F1 ATP synthase subunit B [Pseudodesulfovibrio indicus]|uniref:ATP synthase subunit b n=1 Tax=Pseudodesulfovibrio indicus TaxID=1716143 RepID=A0A140D9H6_9BACT|nr:ATP synthase subunit B [Pseudodesulfovibrio indicus]TDT87479.1 ATP synthase F0 subcomplex B subunit [Pseudodesulfovibrio indicus]